MATVINLPTQDRETTASHIGNAIGKVLAHRFNEQERQENAKQAQAFIEAVRTAPDRAAGLEVIGKFAPLFRDPNDVAFAYRTLDEAHPQSGEQSQVVTTYDAEGNAFPRAIRNKDLPRINTPEGAAELLGGEGRTLTKPDVRDWYTVGSDGSPVFAGKGASRPEGGKTLQEIQLEQQGRAETFRVTEAAKRDARADERQDLAERRFLASQERMAQMLARIGANQGEASVGRMQRTAQSAMTTLATTMGGRGLEDGTFVFTTENQKKLFYDRVAWMQNMIEADPRILQTPTAVMQLVTGSARALPGTDTAEPDPLDKFARDPKKKPDAQGKIKRPEEKPKPTPQKVPDADRAAAAAQLEQKAKEISGRGDLSQADKQRAISRLRDIAKANNINVRF